MNRLLFGKLHDLVVSQRVMTVHTPGGTAALRIGADFIKSQLQKANIWVSNPTWGNHLKIFQTAGLTVKTYPYYNAERRVLLFEQMVSTLEGSPEIYLISSASAVCSLTLI